MRGYVGLVGQGIQTPRAGGPVDSKARFPSSQGPQTCYCAASGSSHSQAGRFRSDQQPIPRHCTGKSLSSSFPARPFYSSTPSYNARNALTYPRTHLLSPPRSAHNGNGNGNEARSSKIEDCEDKDSLRRGQNGDYVGYAKYAVRPIIENGEKAAADNSGSKNGGSKNGGSDNAVSKNGSKNGAGNGMKVAVGEADTHIALGSGAASERPWAQLKPVWEADESVAMASGIMNALASPTWRVMLLSDGSVTRHLQLLTDIKIQVECIEQEVVESTVGLPADVSLIPGPLIQRQVYLSNSATGEKLVYAVSWWSKAEMDKYMKEMDAPIWVNLQARKAELYRAISRIYLGGNAELAQAFNNEDERPMWGRHYTFYHQGRPLTVIYEVFSNGLETYLGPSSTMSSFYK